MNNSKYLFSSVLFLVSLNSFAAITTSVLDSADTLYKNGDCEKAIPAYEAIPNSSLDQAGKDKVLFKTSYCHFSLGQYQESENGFKNYLSTHSTEEEAILKYSQSLLYQNKFAPAESAAKKINSANFKTDAAIVIARAQMEQEEYRKANITLRPYLKNAEAIYWRGVIDYREDLDDEAEGNFKLAAQIASKDSWIQAESKSWLDRINQEKKKFHVRLTVGLLKDSNLDQSGGTGTIGEGGPGPGGAGGPGQSGSGPGGPGMTKPVFTNANYTNDSGKYAAVDFIHNTYNGRKLSLTTSASLSSPFYNDHPTYNQESASLDFNLKRTESSTFNYGASLKYLDTFYNHKYSQDYIYVTPTASWSFAPDYWLKFSIPITSYLNSKKIKLYGGNVDLYYDATSWLSLSLGGSTSKSSAPDTVIKNAAGSDFVSSGTIFSHYSSTGAYVGLTFYIGDTWQLGATGSTYKTKYDLETMPVGQIHKPREDKMKTYQMSVTKSFIQNVLSANLSYSHTDNTSVGYPGIAYSGTISNNTYKRNYSLLTLEYYY